MMADVLSTVITVFGVILFTAFMAMLIGLGCCMARWYICDKNVFTGEYERDKGMLICSIGMFVIAAFFILLALWAVASEMGW